MAASRRPSLKVSARLLAGLFVVGCVGPAAAAPIASPASVQRGCELIGGRLQSVGTERCLHAGLQVANISSVNGNPILWRDFLPLSQRATPRRVLLMGGIHGDELSSVSIVFQWMQRLGDEREQSFHWRVIPCLNPDGLLLRRPTRTNARGVDLNRNFPTPDWKSGAMAYWENRTKKDPRRYPGEGPLSEPETRLLVQMIEEFKPDAIVSIHAPYGVLDYDGPDVPPERFGYLRLNQLGTYPGSLGNYAGIYLQLPVITLELPHAGLMPTAAQSQRIWSDMLSWLEKNVPRQQPALYERLQDQPWMRPLPMPPPR